MLEMKITVEAPALAASVLKLAEAIASRANPNVLSVDSSSSPTPPALAPVSAPAVSVPALDGSVNPAPAAAVPVNPAPQSPSSAVSPVQAVNQVSAAPAVPVADAPAYTLDQIARAGAALVDAGKMDQLTALLSRYGVQAITQLRTDQYGVFATELRAMGAQI